MGSCYASELIGSFRLHGYPDIQQHSQLNLVAERLVSLLESHEDGLKPQVLNAHLRHELRDVGMTDATTWLSVLRGSRVKNVSILKDLLPKLTHRFRPTHLGHARSDGSKEAWVVTILIHRGATFNWSAKSVTHEQVSFHFDGRLSRGYFQPQILIELPQMGLIRQAVAVNSDRSFDLIIDTPASKGPYAFELVAEHVSGPRVLHVARYNHLMKTPVLPVVRLAKVLHEDSIQGLLRRIQHVRHRKNLRPLVVSASLNAAAHEHARFIASHRTLSHRNDASGHLRQRLAHQNKQPTTMSELLVFAPTPLAAFGALEESPAHRVELRQSSMNRIGIGMVDDYYVIILAQFESPSVEVD